MSETKYGGNNANFLDTDSQSVFNLNVSYCIESIQKLTSQTYKISLSLICTHFRSFIHFNFLAFVSHSTMLL